jgi:hypothetical protein
MQAPKRKRLFSVLYGTYSVILNDLKRVLQGSASKPNSSKVSAIGPVAMEVSEDGFREQRRLKRNNSEELRQGSNKKAAPKAAKTMYGPKTAASTFNEELFSPDENSPNEYLRKEYRRGALLYLPPKVRKTYQGCNQTVSGRHPSRRHVKQSARSGLQHPQREADDCKPSLARGWQPLC